MKLSCTYLLKIKPQSTTRTLGTMLTAVWLILQPTEQKWQRDGENENLQCLQFSPYIAYWFLSYLTTLFQRCYMQHQTIGWLRISCKEREMKQSWLISRFSSRTCMKVLRKIMKILSVDQGSANCGPRKFYYAASHMICELANTRIFSREIKYFLSFSKH
jgi:hypothetical protein